MIGAWTCVQLTSLTFPQLNMTLSFLQSTTSLKIFRFMWTGKTLVKISEFSQNNSSRFFLFSRLIRISTALSERLTRSLSVRLSSAQHKSPRSAMFTIFFLSGSGRAEKKFWWKFMCFKVFKFIIFAKEIQVSWKFRVGKWFSEETFQESL